MNNPLTWACFVFMVALTDTLNVSLASVAGDLFFAGGFVFILAEDKLYCFGLPGRSWVTVWHILSDVVSLLILRVMLMIKKIMQRRTCRQAMVKKSQIIR
ncbi:hypothetical protein ACGVWS_03770 [Enterobacteriaceae bacterium LUAb1]